MKDDTTIFGAKSDNLDRLLRFALEPPEEENQAAQTVSLDTLTEKPGGRIDKYKLLHVLGEGGMGIVYLAEQTESVRRQVALKVIKPGMDSKRVIARFEAEKQALALMQHPNISGVYDAGLTLTGRPYFVMEYVKGTPITDYCDHNKLTIKDRLRLFQQICQAVQHAHQKGIIHRDIKPSNILVTMENEKAIPKIIDFGVAKATGKPLTERTLATEGTQLLGTPEYMSPEQADMASEDIDTRSDVYSLGVLLYVLLTGVLPFDFEKLRDSGIENIRKTIRQTDPKTPSTRLVKLGEEATAIAQNRGTEINTLEKHLRKELEWIPIKAMRKERSERYRSASELADDIENYLKGVPLIAGPPTNVYHIKKFVRRHAALSAATLTVSITIILGLVGITVMYFRAERALGDAQAITDFLTIDVLRAVNDANAYEQSLIYVLDTASKKLDQGRFKERPIVEATIRGELGWTYRLLGKLDTAEQHSLRALQICEEQLGEYNFQTTQKMFHLGLIYTAQNRWNDALSIFNRQLAAVQRGHPTEFHAPYISLGLLFEKMGQYKKSEECFLKKIEIVRRVNGKNAPASVASRLLAGVYHRQGRYEEAEKLYLKLLKTSDSDSEDRGMLNCMDGLGDVYRDQGRYKEAEELYKSIIKKRQHFWGERTAISTIGSLARLYMNQGNYDRADELFKEIDDIIDKSENSSKPTWYLYNLAVLRTKQCCFDEAESLFEEVRNRWQHKLGEIADDHPEMLSVINSLGVLRREQKRYEEAEKYFLDAVEGRLLKLGDQHPHTIESTNNLIALYEAWNKLEKAEEWREKLQKNRNCDRVISQH
jgi:serine/threonine protein kinase/lipopolysaccharide biosynthesis regulator YciM